MAFKGGYYAKPVDADFDGLVGLYAQGKARAEQTREGVRKERGEQTKALVEASMFEATQIEELDQFVMGTASQARDILYQAHKDNIAGKGTRASANSEAANQTTQMQMLGKTAELMKTQIEEAKKLVADGEISQATLENIFATWFNQKDVAGMINLPDGTQRPAKKSLTPAYKTVNGRAQHGVIVRQEYQDENGEIQVFEGYRSLSELLSPDTRTIKQVTYMDKAQEIRKNYGDRETYVDESGAPLPNPFWKKLGIEGTAGEEYYARSIAQETFPDIINSVEGNISAVSDDEYVSILYALGGGSVTDSRNQFKGYRKKEVVNGTYQHLYDKKGQQLSFESDPLVIQRGENMEYVLSEDNKKLVDALLRDNIYKGMDVSIEELRTGRLIDRGANPKKPETFPMGDLEVAVWNPDTNKKEASLVNSNYLQGVLANEIILTNLAKGEVLDITAAQQAVNDWYIQGKNPAAATSGLSNTSEVQKIFEGVTDAGISGKTMPGFDKVDPDLTLTSFGGFEMETVRGLVAVRGDDRITLHALGDVEVASMDNALKAGGGSEAGEVLNKLGLSQVTRNASLSNAIPEPIQKTIWQKYYMANPDFRAKADAYARQYGLKSGYDISVIKLDDNQTIGIADHWEAMLMD